ncbi:glycoside hydrolase family 88 protein [Sphingobacterium hungaricum]|uniref:Glucuronyl hydrolase n=1 Tax=Sphingobacterium hungaricum TaxID=2082723 RepID=A0A928UV87_9SPHI|nr:glycoside hydrolase family 88 protein [Sphingobacterium hungaricum]MBE8713573.1 glucuronyl hydrolase [Sphingobacterium hungaricum]
MKKYNLIFGFIFIFLSASFNMHAQTKKNDLTLSKTFINQNLADATLQIKYLDSQLKPEDIPTTYKDGKHVNWESSWWCSGFYPGTLLYLYEASNDKALLDMAKVKLKYLEKEKYNKGTHDLGFMLFCSFGNAWRLTDDSSAYKEVLTTGAESLASRFKPIPATIRSWDGKPWNYPVIIDNMMNLEFLFQVSKITGNPKYKHIAVTHANTTTKNAFRPDFSSYHVVDYNAEDGTVIAKKTAQGAFDESAWARGQAWGLYGYTVMYRETKDKKYLEQAKNIASFYLNHPNLPEDLVPYWDFDQNKLASDNKYYSKKDLRDASAAAIAASALLELAQYSKGKEGKSYLAKAEKMIQTLSSNEYKAASKENGGYILQHSVGSIPHNTEIDVPLTYADYYYVEALVRYKRLLDGEKVIKSIID